MSDVYDIVIIGGGPAGLTAGLYAARARMKAVL
ncbi:MAG: FAD-binding protein, partial [Syntrophobacteraceae bacterium]